MTTYYSVSGQSLFDVCLNTYGSLDYLYKLLADNNVANINAPVVSNQAFIWDETLTTDQNISKQIQALGINMATVPMANGANYFSVVDTGQILPTPTNIFTPTNPATLIKYQITKKYDYVATVDNTSVITIIALQGYDILQVENETRPLLNTDYVWNKATGTLTLQNGITLGAGQTLFLLYTQILNS